MSEPGSGYWVILLTLVVAGVLAVLPLGFTLNWWRPEWVALVMLYWAIALPHRVGLVTALAVGFLLDVLEGAVIGQHMLAMAVVVSVARLLYQRLRVFTLVQQALVVFVLIGIYQLIVQWVHNLEGVGSKSFVFLLPAMTSAAMWLLVMPALRGLRRGFQVQ